MKSDRASATVPRGPRIAVLAGLVAAGMILGIPFNRAQTETEPPALPANLAEMRQVTEWSLLLTKRKLSGAEGWEGEALLIHEAGSNFEHVSAEGVLELQTQGPAGITGISLPPGAAEQLKALGLEFPAVPTDADDAWQWAGVGRGELRINKRWASTETHSGRTETRTRKADDESPVQLRLMINFTKGTYSISVDAPHTGMLMRKGRPEMFHGKSIEVVEEDTTANPPTVNRSRTSISFRSPEHRLPKSGTTLQGKITRRGREREEIFWKLVPKTRLPRVHFERTDDTFLPEPNGQAGISIRWDHGRPDETVVQLGNISREAGTCINSQDTKTDPDVAFAPGQPNLAVSGATATAKQPLTRVNLITFDYAAYAEISVRVRFGNAWVQAKSADNKDVISLVPDDDNNQISDFWQSLVQAENKPRDWDADDQPRQAKKKGDGLTVADEYRGMFVAGGRHQRLDPRKMELVAIDPEKLLDPGSWVRITGAGVVFIDSSQHQGQTVNFNSSHAGSHPKYALLLKTVPGLLDPLGTAVGNHIWGQTDAVVADQPATSRVFPDRPLEGLRNYLHPRIRNAIAQPSSADGVELLGFGYTPALLRRVEGLLGNPAALSKYMERVVRHIALHEAAHACDINHHNPDTAGELTCPMRNLTRRDKMYELPKELAAGVSGIGLIGMSKLCTTQDNCWAAFRLSK